MQGVNRRHPKKQGPSIRNVHLAWPLDFADRVDAIVAERGMSKQEIIMRVMHQAMETSLVYDWITKPVTPPKETFSSQEVATGT